MASRRRRVDRSRPPVPPGGLFFGRKPYGSSAGRVPWRARNVRSLLRPVPLGLSPREVWRPTVRPAEALRSRSDRTAAWVVQPGVTPRASLRRVRLLPLGKPVLSERATPCRRRSVRKQVLFSKDVAGRRWGRGGPVMRDARYTVDSQYSCGG